MSTIRQIPTGRAGRHGNLAASITRHLVLVVLAVIILFPLYYALVGSFMGPADIATYPPALFPHAWLTRNFSDALKIIPLARQYLNSAIMAIAIMVFQIVTAILSAYAFVFLPMPFRRTLFGLFMLTMMVPFESIIIPNYLTVTQTGLSTTYAGSLASLALPFLAAGFGTFLLRQSFKSFPISLLEAARIDGCGSLRFIWRILVPLTRPTIAALGVYVFLNSWNQYFWPLLVTGDTPNHQTIQIGISQLQAQDTGNDPGMVLAGVVLALIPTLLLVFFGQRFIVRGLTTGAVK